MLKRLYEPIIWRSFKVGFLHYISAAAEKSVKCDACTVLLGILYMWTTYVQVANDSVRASALSLLIDAFPLQDPGANIEATDTLRQKQFDILSVSRH